MIAASDFARLLVKRLEVGAAEERACAGEQAPRRQGRVIAKDRESALGLGVALGDRVSFAEDVGDELQIGGQRHWILRENEVLAVLA
jgi:co-chaperonin GroES (HSP10)